MYLKKTLYIFLIFLQAAQYVAQVDTLAIQNSLPTDTASFHTDSSAVSETIDALIQTEAVDDAASEAAIAEDLSYRYYLSKEWTKLLPYTEHLFSKGIDYYYMRMRAGIAAYELKQYRFACIHFAKALAFKPNDDIANEYLYFALLYADRNDEALKIRRSFSTELNSRLGFKTGSVLMSVFNETGIKTSTNANFDNAIYSQLSLQHNIAGRVSFLHAGNYFTQNEKRFSVEQAQYYLRANVPLKKGFSVMAAGHAIQINIKERVSYTTTVVANLPPDPKFPNSGDTRTVLATVKAETLIPLQKQSFIACAAIAQETKWLSWQLGASYAQLDTTTQTQLNANLQVFPLKNNNIIIGSNFYLHQEKQNAAVLALAPFVLWHPSQKLYLTATWFNNAGNNISEYNAQLFTNSIDYTKQRYSGSLYYAVHPRVWLYGNFGYELKQHIKENYNYAYYIYAIGLKLSFH